MNRFGLLALLVLTGASPVYASLDPGLDKPYRLQIVLHIAENRFLTPTFQDQVQRDLQDQLRLALGPLAIVEVVRTHPLLRTIENRGLDGGLDGSDKLSDAKVHFVLIDYSAGVYAIQARQLDGLTGLASPVVRTAQTADRTVVARICARLVEQDFGLVGTVIEVGKEVRLALRGGKLVPSLDKWVQPGDVFEISRITRQGDAMRGQRVSWALLEVLEAPRDGVCRCRLWHRFQEDNLKDTPTNAASVKGGGGSGVLGYRALRLTTRQDFLRIRLLDDKTLEPLSGIQVHVQKPGEKQKTEISTKVDGLAVSRTPFTHFVLVQVISGESIRAQFPVALIDDRPVTCLIRNQAEAEIQAPVYFRRDQWVRRLYDNLRLASERVADLNLQLSKSLDKALAAAKLGLENMTNEVEQLTLEHDQLLRQATERKIAREQLDLREGEQRLTELGEKHKELNKFVQRLEKVLQESKSEKTLGLAKLLERARLLEGEADFDQAIILYEKVLAAAPDQAKVRAQLEQLKKAWAVKGDKHADARAFIYQVWPRLDVRDLKPNLDKAQKALAMCLEAGDRLTPLKMLLASNSHVSSLKKHLDALRRQDTEDSRTQAKVIADVADGLRRLHAEAAAWVKSR